MWLAAKCIACAEAGNQREASALFSWKKEKELRTWCRKSSKSELPVRYFTDTSPRTTKMLLRSIGLHIANVSVSYRTDQSSGSSLCPKSALQQHARSILTRKRTTRSLPPSLGRQLDQSLPESRQLVVLTRRHCCHRNLIDYRQRHVDGAVMEASISVPETSLFHHHTPDIDTCSASYSRLLRQTG